MNPEQILKKFGDQYQANELTFKMGIDQRFTSHFAERFKSYTVLETCTGAGFSTIALAHTAKHVYTVEINKFHQGQAIHNIKKAGLSHKVTFINDNILNPNLQKNFKGIDAVFIDPDWADTGSDHDYRFKNSNTKPPADIILNLMLEWTENVAIILPPLTPDSELSDLPPHERERLFMGDSHELYCLYFGKLMKKQGVSDFCI